MTREDAKQAIEDSIKICSLSNEIYDKSTYDRPMKEPILKEASQNRLILKEEKDLYEKMGKQE